MSTAEQIYKLVKTMPEDQVIEVLGFAEFLQQKTRAQSTQPGELLSDYAGILKDSPNFNEDPVELQRKMRNEWS